MSTSRLIKPPRKARACANCACFAATGTVLLIGGSGILRPIGSQALGDCRAQAPGWDRKSGDARWPEVMADEWCARFVRIGSEIERRVA